MIGIDPTLIDDEAEAKRIENDDALRIAQELSDGLEDLHALAVKLYDYRKTENSMVMISLIEGARLRSMREL